MLSIIFEYLAKLDLCKLLWYNSKYEVTFYTYFNEIGGTCMKRKNKKQTYTYSFTVISHDYFPYVVDITRNGDAYCRFSCGSFLDMEGNKFDDMPIDEKFKIWKWMSRYGNCVGEHDLELSF